MLKLITLVSRFTIIHVSFLINIALKGSLLYILQSGHCNRGQPILRVSTFVNATLDYNIVN